MDERRGDVDMPRTIIKIVDDKEYVNIIKRKLKENQGYCPCRLTKNADTKCMCKEFRETTEGICHCGLYEKIIIEDERNEE